MDIFTDLEAQHIIRRRVCARCYGHVIQKAVPEKAGKYTVECPTCGEAWGGRTVSKWTAEHRAQQALAEAWEVKENLIDLFPNPHKGRDQEKLIEELVLR